MSGRDTDNQGNRLWRKMTVAQIRPGDGARYSEVVFLESARFYKLYRNNPRYDEILKDLRHALAKRRALKVRLASPEGDVVENVEELDT